MSRVITKIISQFVDTPQFAGGPDPPSSQALFSSLGQDTPVKKREEGRNLPSFKKRLLSPEEIRGKSIQHMYKKLQRNTPRHRRIADSDESSDTSSSSTEADSSSPDASDDEELHVAEGKGDSKSFVYLM